MPYALGFPRLPSLGVCPDHQHVTIPANEKGLALDVTVRGERDGVYYEISEAGDVLGQVTFPSNTRKVQARGQGSDRLLAAGQRVAVAFGHAAD